VHRPGSNCISNVQEINRNSTKFSLLTWTWSRFKSSWLEPYIKEYCYHYSLQGYWGDDVTIYQLVITMSFHFSLLSLIACYITIVIPESTIQSYQYITTVTLFTRTQSLTLGPRYVISCSDLFTYLPSLCKGVTQRQVPFKLVDSPGS